MNRRCIFTLSAITVLALAFVPGSTVAQQKPLKEQLVGIWTALSAETTGPNGAKQQFYGAPAKGILILDAGGIYAQVLARPGRPKFKSINRFSFEATPEELKVAVTGTVATFGTWSVNEADKTLTIKTEGALIPNGEGAEGKLSVSLTGDDLKLVATFAAGGKAESVYRRAK